MEVSLVQPTRPQQQPFSIEARQADADDVLLNNSGPFHLVFPEVFVACSGCSREAPDNEPADSSTAGCCCLSCPTWFACNDCAAKELQAHRAAHPDHIAYSVDAEDELRARECASQFPPLNRWVFVFDCFLWPLFKMFVPLMSVLVQVSTGV